MNDEKEKVKNINNPDITKFHIPRWEELPNIDLFLEQVVTLINNHLAPYIFINSDAKEENELLTKTMINNYVKQEIIEPPVNKKYNRLHIAELFVICILKQVYSISEVKSLINLALEANSAENSYNRFCDYLKESLVSTFNGTEYSSSTSLTPEQYLLKNVVQSVADKMYVEFTFLNKDK